MSKKRILVYGGYGFIGTLVCEYLLKNDDFEIVVGGKNPESLKQIEKFETVPFKLSDVNIIENNLKEFAVVINCAAPIVSSYRSISEAALRAKTHYIDVSYDPTVFEGITLLDDEAKEHNVYLATGAGLSHAAIVALAKELEKEENTQPTAIGIYSKSRFSKGEIKEQALNAIKGVNVLSGGEIKVVNFGSYNKKVNFRKFRRALYAISNSAISVAKFLGYRELIVRSRDRRVWLKKIAFNNRDRLTNQLLNFLTRKLIEFSMFHANEKDIEKTTFVSYQFPDKSRVFKTFSPYKVTAIVVAELLEWILDREGNGGVLFTHDIIKGKVNKLFTEIV